MGLYNVPTHEVVYGEGHLRHVQETVVVVAGNNTAVLFC